LIGVYNIDRRAIAVKIDEIRAINKIRETLKECDYIDVYIGILANGFSCTFQFPSGFVVGKAIEGTLEAAVSEATKMFEDTIVDHGGKKIFESSRS
jgi:uncharacterized protein (UPF0212 family)